jgi:hypothetical protein
MKGEFQYHIPNLLSDLVLSFGEDRFFIPIGFLKNIDLKEPLPVYPIDGGYSIGSVFFHDGKWKIETNRYQGVFSAGHLDNVYHFRQKKGSFDYSYLISKSQQTLAVV